MANARTRTVPVEGAIAAFHSEVKLGPCTSVFRIHVVLHDIIINKVYIESLYTIFRIAHQGTFILHVFINTECFTTCTTIIIIINAKCAGTRPDFGVGSIKLSFRTIVFTQYMHAKMFSIQMLLYTFQSNCAEGLHFSAFH